MKAFPTPAFTISEEARVTSIGGEGGMELRDYFAAKAMQALITNEVVHSITLKEAIKAGIPEEFAVATMSFIIADAMMKARQA
jgi:hypothetical protein